MLAKILINGLFLLGLLLTPARAEKLQAGGDDLLPAGVKNTMRADFGMVALTGDYGQANVTPVEIVGGGERREVRIFRSPLLRLYKKKANMQVLLGNVKGVYVWVEGPPVQTHWHVALDLLYLDGGRNNIFSQDLKPGVRHFVSVIPNTRVDCQISTKTTAVKLNVQCILNISPLEWWAIWPEYLPIPFIPMFHGHY
jgi:hypothetical protein